MCHSFFCGDGRFCNPDVENSYRVLLVPWTAVLYPVSTVQYPVPRVFTTTVPPYYSTTPRFLGYNLFVATIMTAPPLFVSHFCPFLACLCCDCCHSCYNPHLQKRNRQHSKDQDNLSMELTPVTCEDLALCRSVPTRRALLETLPYLSGLVVRLKTLDRLEKFRRLLLLSAV
jgi:hypothetical protein